MNFDTAFEFVIGVEAGYVNDPHDPGGETKYGISKRAHPKEDIAELTLARAKEIYKIDYWYSAHCDAVAPNLRLAVFDCAVNQGVKTAIKLLQETYKVSADGIWGPVTSKVTAHASTEQVALFLVARVFHYIGIGNFDRYGKGWIKRLFLLAMELGARR